MHFDSLSDLFYMGGYASYVWGAFASTFGALGLIFLSSRLDSKATLKEVKNRMDRQARIDAAKNMENTL
ncbi:heme exporter protein CcmD [Vibrio breoganii]|uniref:heme exporter protein CcmD n=1 Tax=Vibrio breoganii TaxID=553239 RepID=UPI000C836731|nr:heme exporter protein CcmD [Vibrio breoganii]PMG96647.1 heme exporter protein CcmD [Vibrio breoganii]PMJ47483.1 heme exporter protein CcmD [Vibrio breoganii]PMK57850.1 heme exporter protein CcmD [Vibrio breoganii]PMK61180.1 heme exporter protein CcmD [Vibrio breoganii]PMK73126.1 heme exporter protein CcmD [Vibrio breoganii]